MALASLFRQTYQNWEMIIIGDCSPYGAQIESWIETLNDARVRFLNLEKRAGITSPGTIPKQNGIRIARGELLAFLDADNEYFPEHLERCVAILKNNPEIDLVYGNTIVKMTNASRFAFTWRKPHWNKKIAAMLERVNFLDMSEPVFRREAYEASGGLDSSHHASDWFLWRAMIKAGRDRFFHSNHFGLLYHTRALLQYLSYFLMMLAQMCGISYKSENLQWMQRYVKMRFERRYE